MGPLITREHRDKVAGYLDVADDRRRHRRRRRPRRRASTATADGFWLGPTLVDHVPTDLDGLHRRDLRPGALGRAGRLLRRGRRASSTPARTATAPRSSPTTAAPPGASSARSRSAWSASTCRSRCPWPTTPSAAGRRSLFGDAKAYGPHGVDFFTREKAVTAPLARPQPRRHQPRLPAARLRFRRAAARRGWRTTTPRPAAVTSRARRRRRRRCRPSRAWRRRRAPGRG